MGSGSKRGMKCRVHGRVQGVGFRYSTSRKARSLGLTGWVRNEYDGTVEVVAFGDEHAISQLATWLDTGPPGARVTRVDASSVPYSDAYRTFSIEY